MARNTKLSSWSSKGVLHTGGTNQQGDSARNKELPQAASHACEKVLTLTQQACRLAPETPLEDAADGAQQEMAGTDKAIKRHVKLMRSG